MTIAPITSFSGQLPTELDPVTFSDRMNAFAEYEVNYMIPELNQMVSEINAALGIDGSVLAGVAEAAPAGLVGHFARITAPAGWLKANGAAVPRSHYAALFGAIGTTYGAGDGSTTFNLPDLRGEFLRGWDDARGVDAGRAFGSAQAGTIFPNASGTSTPSIVASHFGSVQQADTTGPNIARSFIQSGLVSTTQGFGSFTARPRNVALLACIKF